MKKLELTFEKETEGTENVTEGYKSKLILKKLGTEKHFFRVKRNGE